MTRQRRIIAAALAFGCYLLLACLLYWPVLPLDGSHLVGCACSDPVQEVWFLRWSSFAVGHGLDPLFTHYLNQPHGANLAVNTSMPLLGILAWPITHFSNAVAAYNALLRVGIALSAWSMFLVMRRYTRWFGAAFGAGLLFGFSAFVTAHAQRHLFLVFLPLVPLFIPLLDDWLFSKRRSAARSGLAVGVVAAVQYLISPEVLLIVVIGAGCAIAVLALRDRDLARASLRRAGIGLACAAAAMVLVDGYPVWMLLAGPQRPSGPPHPVVDLARYRGDLLSLILPTRNLLVAPNHLIAPSNQGLREVGQEDGFYLGVPLLLLLGYGVRRLRTSVLVVAAAVTAIVGLVLGLGTPLTVGGRTLSTFVFRVFQSIPVLQNLEAARFSLLVQIGAAVILAMVLDGWRRHGAGLSPAVDHGNSPTRVDVADASKRTVTIAVVAVLCLLPIVPRRLPSAPTAVPSLFTTSAVKAVPAGALTLTFPFDESPQNDAMLWQALSDMRFRIFGGDVFTRTPTGTSTQVPKVPLPPRLVALLTVRLNAHRTKSGDVALLTQFLQTYRVRFVLVDTAVPGALRFESIALTALGSPSLQVGSIIGWSVGSVGGQP